MDLSRRILLWVGVGLVGLGLILLVFSLFPGWSGRADPAIIFLTLAAAFVFFLFSAPPEWRWLGWIYIPTCLFIAMGIVFLLNAVTNDWNAWAYAWMFCIAGLGVGLAIAARTTAFASDWIAPHRRLFYHIGIWTALGGLALCSIFGAIARGPFMRYYSFLLLGLLILAAVNWYKTRVNWLDWNALPAVTPSHHPPVGIDSGANQGLVEPLSKRELEVLHWIDQGLSNAEIAGRMTVAQSTVKTHINNIYAKLGVQSRTQALRRAKELHLLDGQSDNS